MLDTTVDSHYFDGVSFTEHFGFLAAGVKVYLQTSDYTLNNKNTFF